MERNQTILTLNSSRIFASAISSDSVVANRLYSGGTDLSNIFAPITLSGTSNFTALSAGTIYSGGTDLYNIFATIGSAGPGGTGSTYIQPGTNIITGGTVTVPIISVSASPIFNNLTASGITYTSVLNNSGGGIKIAHSDGTPAEAGQSSVIAGGVFNHIQVSSGGFQCFIGGGSTNIIGLGGTNVYYSAIVGSSGSSINWTERSVIAGGYSNNIISGFSSVILGGNSNYISGVSNVAVIATTGVTATTSNTVYVPSLRASGVIYSGGTNLYNIFQAAGTSVATNVQPGSNISTGGTPATPTISVVKSPSLENLSLSGTGTASAFSAATLSGGGIYSGSTNLYNIFVTTDTNTVTNVQPGANISTGGTSTAPTINLAASPSVNNFTTSGVSTNIAVSAGTLSASTLYSGATNLSRLFIPPYSYSTGSQTVNPGQMSVISGCSISLVNNPLRVGSKFDFSVVMTKTASGTLNNVFAFKLGTNGTTADTTVMNFQLPVATGAADSARTDVQIIISGPLGVACRASGNLTLTHNLQTTGFATTAGVNIPIAVSGGFDSSTPTFATLCLSAAAVTTISVTQSSTNTFNL